MFSDDFAKRALNLIIAWACVKFRCLQVRAREGKNQYFMSAHAMWIWILFFLTTYTNEITCVMLPQKSFKSPDAEASKLLVSRHLSSNFVVLMEHVLERFLEFHVEDFHVVRESSLHWLMRFALLCSCKWSKRFFHSNSDATDDKGVCQLKRKL